MSYDENFLKALESAVLERNKTVELEKQTIDFEAIEAYKQKVLDKFSPPSKQRSRKTLNLGREQKRKKLAKASRKRNRK